MAPSALGEGHPTALGLGSPHGHPGTQAMPRLVPTHLHFISTRRKWRLGPAGISSGLRTGDAITAFGSGRRGPLNGGKICPGECWPLGVFRDLRRFSSREDDYNVILGCGKHLSPLFGVILKIVLNFRSNYRLTQTFPKLQVTQSPLDLHPHSIRSSVLSVAFIALDVSVLTSRAGHPGTRGFVFP